MKTKLFSSRHGAPTNEEIAQVLLDHTLRVVNSTKLPLITLFTQQQQGNTFGERLANAFQEAFAAGYQRVICVGSDCPTLAASDLYAAQEALRHNSLVIGPATDGGAYLIGIQKESFQQETFCQLNWQTAKVLGELQAYARQHSEAPEKQFFLLAQKSDVDDEQGLIRELERLLEGDILKKLLQALLASEAFKPAQDQAIGAPFELPIGSVLLRAPPF